MSRARSALREIPHSRRTVIELLDRGAERFGQKSLVRFPSTTLSYETTRSLAARRAGGLRQAGIEVGDRVALMSSNREELLELVLGCIWAGAIPIPMNTAIRGEQLRHVLTDSGARLLVAEADFAEALRTIDRPDPAPERIWLLDEAATELPDWADCTPLPEPGEPVEAVDAGPGDVAAILYTSGTTGPSKGVCCPHAQLFWFAALTAELLEVGEQDVLYTALPLFHVNALTAVLQALGAGASITVDSRFSASRYWSRCAEEGATVTYLLGAMISILDRQPPTDHDNAHEVRIALSPATPADLLDGFRRRFGVELVEGYASTETNVAMISPAGEQRPGMMGYVAEGFEARVVDEMDAEVPAGEAGELVLRHSEPFAFANGYWGLPEKTVEAWRNLWFHTGDQVVREADGWFRFIDRIKDAIRRRGENISSFEVEQAILTHVGVEAAAVFPVPSELGEDEVMAAVVGSAGTSPDPAELIEHLRPRLARFAIPRYIELVEELPLTANGKVRKAELRERGVGPGTWDRESAERTGASRG